MRQAHQVAAVRAGQRPGDGQAQPGAAVVAGAAGIQAHQPVENALPLVVRDARAGVGDGDLGGAVAGAQVDLDGAAGRGVAASVVEQVGHDLRQPGGVGPDVQRGESRAAHADLGCQQGRPVGFVAQHGGHVDVVQFQRKPGVDAAQVQHVVDESPGAARVGEQQARPTVLPVVGVFGGAVRELLGGDLHAGDRGAQLVGGVDEEAPGRRLGALGGLGGLLGPAFRHLQGVQHRVESACGAA
ncbi:hypothetical protein PICSAR181_04573 [Mycobacterium avium subsp. paratuberculosis]|nr:hypothetical protein PICSAR181_04573 [Mycobacterium avium subsp. paratuberculosis]